MELASPTIIIFLKIQNILAMEHLCISDNAAGIKKYKLAKQLKHQYCPSLLFLYLHVLRV